MLISRIIIDITTSQIGQIFSYLIKPFTVKGNASGFLAALIGKSASIESSETGFLESAVQKPGF